jgi:hypothetical protein
MKRCRYGAMLYAITAPYIGRSFDLCGEYSEGEAAVFRQLATPGICVQDTERYEYATNSAQFDPGLPVARSRTSAGRDDADGQSEHGHAGLRRAAWRPDCGLAVSLRQSCRGIGGARTIWYGDGGRQGRAFRRSLPIAGGRIGPGSRAWRCG